MISSLMKWFHSRTDTVVHRGGGRKKTPCRLAVEALEDRSLPSTGWAFLAEGSNTHGYDVEVDAGGNTYVAGNFQGTVDFDPGPGTNNLTAIGIDAFVAKYLADGTLGWARQFASTGGIDFGYGIGLDGAGNILMSGYFDQTVDFDPGAGTALHTSAGNSDIYVMKLDANGNFNWVKQIGGAGREVGHRLAVDFSGNTWVTGFFNGATDFDPGLGVENRASAGDDGFVLHLDAAGDFAWVQTFGGSGSDQGNNITIDAAGNSYVAGRFNGNASFGTTLLTASGDGGFATKLDASGNFAWARALASTSANAVATDASGVYASGSGNFARLDHAGTPIWSKSLGTDYTGDLALDGIGNVYATGSFSGVVDFDPGAGVTYMTTEQGSFLLELSTSAGDFVSVQNVGWDRSYGIRPFTDGLGNSYMYVVGNNGGNVDTGDKVVSLPITGGFRVAKVALDYGAITGHLYADVNNNAAHDATEVPLKGWTVYLDANNNGVRDFGETSVLTGVQGEYRFGSLLPGTYNVRNVLPAGWTQSTPATSVTLTTGQVANGRDFGAVSPAITTTYSASPRLNIQGGATATTSLNVATAGTVYDVNVRVDISFKQVGYLQVYLVGPNGSQIALYDSNFTTQGKALTNTIFDDEAATSITAASAPYTGTFRPMSPLNTVDGISSQGSWTLKVVSELFGYTGKVNSWSLILTTSTHAHPKSVQIGSFTASANPVAVGNNLTLSAADITTTSPSATISQVAFFADTNGNGVLDPDDDLLGYGTLSAGVWSLTFNVSLTPGKHKLLAQAKDSAGLFSDPLALTLDVL